MADVSDELILYTNPQSRGRTARWMLEEVGRPYRTVVLCYDGAMQAPDFLAVNPMGKVPTLVHGGAVVTETAAICAYLADAFPDAGLAPPPGSPARATYYRWLFFAAGPVEAAVTNQLLGVTLPPERERMAGYGTLARVLAAMEGALAAGDYLAGDRCSAADLYSARSSAGSCCSARSSGDRCSTLTGSGSPPAPPSPAPPRWTMPRRRPDAPMPSQDDPADH